MLDRGLQEWNKRNILELENAQTVDEKFNKYKKEIFIN